MAKQPLAKQPTVLVSRLALTSVLVVGAAVAAVDLNQRPVLAQGGNLPPSFELPSELPTDAVLRLDGSTSMVVTNETFRDRLLQRFPDARVELNASRTDEALQRLLAGDLDVVATGRPLSEAERAQGLEEVAIEREKLAIFVGPDNAFDGNLTFEQFARIFRGEITDWAEVGGTPGPIRVVDRPDYSDTRRALSTYEVFQGAPFATGATADPVGQDTTEAVVQALGSDGIGYAVVSQVSDRPDVRILPMHQTLPDDPRYPYSQHRAYVYNSANPSPAALAFLAVATAPPGQELAVANAPAPAPEPTPEQETALVPPAATEAAPARRFPWWLLGIPLLGGLLWWLLKDRGAPAAAPVAPPVAAPAVVPPAAEVELPSRIILTPRNCRRAYAYWEVPNAPRATARDRGGRDLMVRLFDVTDRDADRHPPTRIDQYPVSEDQQDLHLPIPTDNRDYLVELGYITGEDHWLSLAKSDPVRVPACPRGDGVEADLAGVSLPAGAIAGGAVLGAAALGAGLLNRDPEPAPAAVEPTPEEPAAPVLPLSTMVLTPRSDQKAYANWWEVPATAKAMAQAQGGVDHQLRIYDVTDIDIDQQPAHSVLTYDVQESESDREVPIPQGDRDYLAEVGYLTAAGAWLPLARSAPVRVSSAPEVVADEAIAAPVDPPATATAGTCAIETVTVHSRHNAMLLDGTQMHHLQDRVAATCDLSPGSYIVRIKEGVFNYGDTSHSGEPWVLLWIYGGKVQNLKTRVWVNGTWSTLNGYADTLSLEVDEPAKLCAFFIDTFPENNTDAVTLSVVHL